MLFFYLQYFLEGRFNISCPVESPSLTDNTYWNHARSMLLVLFRGEYTHIYQYMYN